jgi:hypothetical protein
MPGIIITIGLIITIDIIIGIIGLIGVIVTTIDITNSGKDIKKSCIKGLPARKGKVAPYTHLPNGFC